MQFGANNLTEIFIFTLPYPVWSSIVIVHEKSVFFCFFFFRNISKTAETILIKKLGEIIPVYKKALIKNYIFRDNNCFVKMSVSLLVSLYVYQIFVDALAQKLE